MKGRCGNCVFWDKYDDSDEGDGRCRRFPPTLANSCEEGTFTMHPETHGDDVCGEFKAAD